MKRAAGTRRIIALAALALAGRAAPAQDVAALLAAGDSAYDALRPVDAARAFEAVLAVDSTRYDANWKAARSIVDVAKQIRGAADSVRRRRDSLYTVARAYAERALRADSSDAEGHFVLALALGQLSRTRGGKARVRFAKIVYDEAARAVAIDSSHDGAHHVLGAWHAEVKRLSGIQKFVAKNLFGGGFLDRASWEQAIGHLERAVALRPDYVFHRLELAQVLVDRKRYAAAREQLASIRTLPPSDVMDDEYQHDAADLAARIRDKRDGS